MSAVDTASRFLLNKSARVLIGLVYGLLLIACATPTPTLQTDRECHPGIDAAVQTGDWETARLAHERLLAENPDNCLALYHLGYIWGQIGDRAQEVQFYEAAVDCGYTDDDRLYFNMGMAYADLGNVPEASRALERAVQLRPHHADNHFGLGLMHQLAGRSDEAEASFLNALNLDRTHEDARLALIRLYLDQSRWDDARQHLRQINAQDPGFEEAKALWQILESREAAEYGHPGR